ncbi:protein FAM110B [Cololabis saira]|uniref:protein FAM110B n=1 Tax=Cololabis saira TaxID=129043 RepID=UPI002AD2E7F5|nr:protein FAM110B [Cololabis saira]
MPVEAVPHPGRQQPVRPAVGAKPPRLRAKGPVGPDFYRRSPPVPKQSAVERLEADKAKYVKSQVALSKQQPVRLPELRKPLLAPGTALRPTKKTSPQASAKLEVVQLDLEHLSNLISDVADRPQAGAAAESEVGVGDEAPVHVPAAGGPPCRAPADEQQTHDGPNPHPDRSSLAKGRLKAPGAAKGETPGPRGVSAAGNVRRVDVMPQVGPVRTARRPPQYIRQPLQPVSLHSKFPPNAGAPHLRVFLPRTAPASSPLKPVVVPSKPDHCPSTEPPAPAPAPAPALAAPALPAFHPPSPAITRLSSSSSRKRPSLTRSKSDMSDRFSRAGTELERFFNLCGLDPTDLPELAGSNADIVSLARFRSVSAPGSECSGPGDRDNDPDEEEDGRVSDRVPYGVSVIERNARVIKWLYGLRQAKDSTGQSTNL